MKVIRQFVFVYIFIFLLLIATKIHKTNVIDSLLSSVDYTHAQFVVGLYGVSAEDIVGAIWIPEKTKIKKKLNLLQYPVTRIKESSKNFPNGLSTTTSFHHLGISCAEVWKI